MLCSKTIWRKYIRVNLGPHSPHHYKSILLPKCKDTFASKISFVDHIWPAAASIGNVIVCYCCLQLSGFDLVSQRVQAGHLYIKEKAKVKAITVLRPHIQLCLGVIDQNKKYFCFEKFMYICLTNISDNIWQILHKNDQLHLCQIPHSKPEIFLFL